MQEFEKVISHSTKLINNNGVIYASYGPLWYTYGGDHFSGRRDKIENDFNHLILDENEYLNYYNNNVGSVDYEIKYKGSGGLFVKEKLFSKIKGNEYMNIFKKNDLISDYTVIEFCPKGYNLIMNNKSIKKNILNKYTNLNIEDCYLKTQIVYLRKINNRFEYLGKNQY